MHPSNFCAVAMPDGESLTMSKLTYGTGSGFSFSQQDFFQYLAMRFALLSGGINHIDTGYFFRENRSERTVGKVLQTMFKKFGLKREEVFINSKQGLLGDNDYE